MLVSILGLIVNADISVEHPHVPFSSESRSDIRDLVGHEAHVRAGLEILVEYDLTSAIHQAGYGREGLVDVCDLETHVHFIALCGVELQINFALFCDPAIVRGYIMDGHSRPLDSRISLWSINIILGMTLLPAPESVAMFFFNLILI